MQSKYNASDFDCLYSMLTSCGALHDSEDKPLMMQDGTHSCTSKAHQRINDEAKNSNHIFRSPDIRES
jgi:hypothetical protein